VVEIAAEIRAKFAAEIVEEDMANDMTPQKLQQLILFAYSNLNPFRTKIGYSKWYFDLKYC
jgi:hypothetical protein